MKNKFIIFIISVLLLINCKENNLDYYGQYKIDKFILNINKIDSKDFWNTVGKFVLNYKELEEKLEQAKI